MRTRLWLSARRCALLFSLLCVSIGLSQQQLPDLAQIKAAAEAGDAQAQDKLAARYYGHFNFSAALEWYRKAAQQGVPHAQCQLGEMLLNGMPKMGESTSGVQKSPDEALKWLLLAANQGFAEAQFSAGSCYEHGTAVKQDSVEAYKWYRVASQKNSLEGKIRLDPLILRLTQQQIQQGEQRAKDFTPHRTMKAELPDPQYVQDIVLKSISGPATRRFALINNQTLGEGEAGKVKAGRKTVTVKCLEIKEQSVIVQIEGIEQPREIGFKPQVR